MVTDISPIFGLPLVGLVDIATFVGVGAIAASGVIAYVIYRGNKAQLEQQKKVNSATLALKILENWSESKHPRFTGFLDRLERSEVTKNDPDMDMFLDEFENIAIFWKDGTLTETHVNEFFGTNLEQISANPVTKDYLKDLKDNHSSKYANLRLLIDANYS